MAALRTAHAVLLATGLIAAPAAGVTPMEKVITLIEGIKTEVETEGAAEARAYNEFACFCKDTTGSKADSITGGKATIDDLSTSIAEDTAQLKVSTSDLTDRKALQESLAKDKAAKELQCQKEETDYKSEAAKMSKAITSIQSAISALESSKPTSSALLELRESAKESPGLAAAVSLMEQRASSLRRVDPLNPEYKFFSQPIIDTLTKLLGEFSGKKTELDDEWSKTKANCDATLLDLGTQMDNNDNAITGLTTTVETLKGTISTAKEQLVLAEGTLKDDKLYLRDLTEQCEKRANDWDQRSATRGEELTALAQVLDILTGHASALDAEVNKRALLLQHANNRTGRVATSPAAAARAIREVPALLQEGSAGAPARAAVGPHDHEGTAAQARMKRVADLLRGEGQKLRSTALVALAFDLRADPFAKVKALIQELIERLLAEANGEATKESYCKKELATAEKERDYRYADAKKLNVLIAELESTKEQLTNENLVLADDIEKLQTSLNESAELREEEHATNMDAIAKAKEGLEAITEAIVILKTFYKQAAKAFLQASPVDEDTQGPGFAGSYKGKQDGAKGVIGMLEVIKTDFQRTITKTKEAEKSASADFVDFERSAESDTSGKETKLALNTEDLGTTTSKLEQAMADLKTAVSLMDTEVKKLEAIHPMCVDNGMSYEERVQKRQAEMEALTRALCILDTNSVEDRCITGEVMPTKR